MVIPKFVTNIGKEIFKKCKKLATVIFEEGIDLLEIPESAFESCTSLKEINILISVKKIENRAFVDRSSLEYIDLSNNIEIIGNEAFGLCASLKMIKLPEPIKTIRECTFQGCKSLTTVIIPKGLEKISFYAFIHCESLIRLGTESGLKQISKGIILPNNIKLLDKDFLGCSLLNIQLPKTVQIISIYDSINKYYKIMDVSDKKCLKEIYMEDETEEFADFKYYELIKERGWTYGIYY